jgi:hypothetical protein
MVQRKIYVVSGSHDNSYKDECLLGCNNGKTDTSIMMRQGNLPPDHMAWHHSRRYLPWKGYTWVTHEVQAQIYKQVHNYQQNMSKTQNTIWTVPWLSQSGGQPVSLSVSQSPITLNLWVQSQASPKGICGGWSINGTFFLLVLRFLSVRFMLWKLHTHISFTYFWCYITLATGSNVKQHARTTQPQAFT